MSIKKWLMRTIPYLLLGLVSTNLGEAWRLVQGADASGKVLGLMTSLPAAFVNARPSLHPFDLPVGLSKVV